MDLRDHISALERAYPEVFGQSRVALDLEHYFAEDDGQAIQDQP